MYEAFKQAFERTRDQELAYNSYLKSLPKLKPATVAGKSMFDPALTIGAITGGVQAGLAPKGARIKSGLKGLAVGSLIAGLAGGAKGAIKSRIYNKKLDKAIADSNARIRGFKKKAADATKLLAGAIGGLPTASKAVGKDVSDENEARLHLLAASVLGAPYVRRLLTKRAEEDKHVAVVAIIKDGKTLMGRRKDNGKWTMPGGHLNNGEDSHSGALREVKEETGIDLDGTKLKFIAKKEVKPGLTIYGYSYEATEGEALPTTSQIDPDEEVQRWHWTDPDSKPDDELHVPRKHNIFFS